MPTGLSLFLLLVMVALLVSSIHMIAPDHWLPLTVISTARDYGNRKKYGTALGLGFAHAGTSIAVALAIFYAGVTFISGYLGYLVLGGQALLVAIGIYFIINGYREKGEEEGSLAQASALSVSAFPDLSIMPIIISAVSLNSIQIAGILVVFALSSAVSLTAMVYAAQKGFGKAMTRIPPRYMDYIIGGILILTALLIEFI